jgi:hypothetical protein
VYGSLTRTTLGFTVDICQYAKMELRGQFFPIFGTRLRSPIVTIHEGRRYIPLKVSYFAQNC